MSDPEHYRTRIEHCTRQAHAARIPAAREIWLNIRSNYELLLHIEKGGLARAGKMSDDRAR
jgi:hypothetical protein